jgi:tetratricopeptide (TPR) repeat protein
MAEVTVDRVPRQVRDMFNKGCMAFERGNYDYAIDLLLACVEAVPGFLQARKFLRAAEIKLFQEKKGGALSRMTGGLSSMPAYFAAVATLKAGKAQNALLQAEKLLRNDPLNLKYILLFADAAMAAGLPEAAVQTLEVARETYPDDAAIIENLGHLYTQLDQPKLARETFERLCELRPHDPAAIKALKDATARESMARDGWAKVAASGGSYREILKDTEETQLLEQKAKAVLTEKDVDALINEALGRLQADPDNIGHYRELGRLYSQKKDFDAAVNILTKAVEKNPGDPEIDAALANAKIAGMTAKAEALRAQGKTQEAEAIELERDQFRFDNLNERVRRYPQDLKLRYEFGVMLFENDYINEAIQQLQLAQKGLQQRISALYYLGLCFKAKQQYDLAMEQLKKALAEVGTIDERRKDILYELGQICEITGKQEEAVSYYKQIYQADISYKDVAQKVENAYQQKK